MRYVCFIQYMYHKFTSWMKLSSQAIFFILFEHIKTDLIFYKPKPYLSKFLKTNLIFKRPKDLILFNKHKSEFSLQKPLFLQNKSRSNFFIYIEIKFFYSQQQIWIFLNKEEDAFLNKFVWFSFVHMYNISFITCMKGVHKLQESRRLDSV